MVNLPKEDEAKSVEGPRPPRNHHNWGARFGRRRNDPRLREDPTTLHQLEELAARAVQVMEKHRPPSEANYAIAMELLRVQYNLTFRMVCGEEGCSGTSAHYQDELWAPER